MTSAAAAPPPGFIDVAARGEYARLAAGIFLVAMTNHNSIILPVIWEGAGFSKEQIGFLFAVYGVPLVGLSFFAGAIAARLGLVPAMRLAATCVALGLASFMATSGDFIGSMLSRLVQGVGFGLFLAVTMTYGTTLFTRARFVQLFAMLSSMAPLPQAIAPVLAEFMLTRTAKETLFFVGALPALAALPLFFTLRPANRDPAPAGSYGRVLRDPAVRLPLLCNVAFGLAFGFITAFLAILLVRRDIPIGAFFTSYTVVLFAVRFGLLGLVERVDRRLIVAFGIAAIGVAYVLALNATSTPAMIFAGVVFGLGHSTGFPVISTWLSEVLPAGTTATSLSISNAVFFAASLGSPIPAAWALARFGYEPVMLAIAAFSILTGAILLVSWRRGPLASGG